jgi:predicted secreted hydrolase
MKSCKSWVMAAIAMVVFTFGLAAPHAAVAAPALSIPADEGPHNSDLEWWYFTGQIKGTDSTGRVREYGYELTFFKPQVVKTFPLAQNYVAHFAITDISRGTHPFEQRIVIQNSKIVPGGGLDIDVAGYHMDGKNGFNNMRATTANGDYSLDLTLESPIAATLHGGDGIIPYGPAGSSYYYSWPNLLTTGTIRDHGETIQITGSSWFDHQWFEYADGQKMGWDWYAIKLDDGSQVMLYFIRNWTGGVVKKVGTLVKPDGTAVEIPESSISSQATGSWFSWRTLRNYASGWKINLPNGQLTVTPRVKDQELYLPPLPTYWEGACDVTGTWNGAPITGKAYTELTPAQIWL